MKPYTTPPFIIPLATWVQRTQTRPSANSAPMLAFGQTESYSVQPCLPLVAMMSESRVFFYWVRPASLMVVPNYTAPTLKSWEEKKRKKFKFKKRFFFLLHSLFWSQLIFESFFEWIFFFWELFLGDLVLLSIFLRTCLSNFFC